LEDESIRMIRRAKVGDKYEVGYFSNTTVSPSGLMTTKAIQNVVKKYGIASG